MTVTDADLVLGYLDPVRLAGGVAVSPELARAAIARHVAGPLGIDVVEGARAVHDIANATLAGAIRLVTVTRGIDPRQFALVAFGGAGPMHACRVADEFGIETVIVPWAAGVAAAVGMVGADAGAERRGAFVAALDERTDPERADPERAGLDLAALDAVRVRLEQDARAELGVDGDDGVVPVTVHTSIGMSVRNQVHTLDVPLPEVPLDRAVAALPVAFAAHYRAEFGVPPTGALQLRSVRVRVTRPAARPASRPAGPTSHPSSAAIDATPVGTRDVHFAERGGFVPTPVFHWSDLGPGTRITGPAVVQAPDTTVVVPPDRVAVVDDGRNLLVTS